MLQRAARGTALLIACAVLLSGCRLPWQKQPLSGLQITTEGSEANVILNGESQGSTPFLHQGLTPGRYAIKLEPQDPNYLPYEATIDLAEGTLAVVSWKFAPSLEESQGLIYEMKPADVRGETSLAISTQPDGAIVSVDDESRGFSPVLLRDITPGSHSFFISLPGYIELKQSVQVVENFQMIVRVKLGRDASLSSDTETATDSAEATASAQLDEDEESTTSARSKNLETSSKIPAEAEGTLTVVETGTGWLRVRESASASSNELTKVDVGDSFPYFDVQSGWYEIEYEAGKRGWVSGQYIETD